MENTPDQNAELNVDINAKVNDENKVFRCHSTNTEIDTLYWWAPLDDQMKSDLLADHSDTVCFEKLNDLRYFLDDLRLMELSPPLLD